MTDWNDRFIGSLSKHRAGLFDGLLTHLLFHCPIVMCLYHGGKCLSL